MDGTNNSVPWLRKAKIMTREIEQLGMSLISQFSVVKRVIFKCFIKTGLVQQRIYSSRNQKDLHDSLIRPYWVCGEYLLPQWEELRLI